MDNPIVWSAILLGVAVLLLLMEFMFPSGVMALIAGVCAIAGMVMLFEISTMVGLIGATASLILIGFLLLWILWMGPSMPFLNAFTLRNPPRRPGQAPGEEDDEFPAGPPGTRPPNISGFNVGMTGKTLSEMRPVGMCQINGRRIDCLAEGGVIRAGAMVRISAVDGMQIKVREVEEA